MSHNFNSPAMAPMAGQVLRPAPALRLLLALVCAWRFIFPFYNNPAEVTASDMGRHLFNGLHLFEPGLWGSIDAKFYQVWLYIVFIPLSGANHHQIIALCTGIISALMPWLWYKAARELFSREKALCFALFIALCPSFFYIYRVFMPETVMLPMLGLSLWMTLRTLRKHTFTSFTLTAWCWVLSAHIKLSVAGMAAVALPLLLWRQKHKLPAAAMVVLALAATCIPAALHSYKNLHVYEPFHFAMPNVIYRASPNTIFTFDAPPNGTWIFSSPSFFYNLFTPFGEYYSWRERKPYHFVINPQHGMADWESALARARALQTPRSRLIDTAENIMYFTAGSSWPDAWENAPHVWQRINFHARWMWPPIILLVLCLGPFAFREASEAKKLTLALTWITLMALLFQQSAVAEGRYRKPVEPFLLISLVIMMEDKRQRGRNGTDNSRAERTAIEYKRDYTLEDFVKD